MVLQPKEHFSDAAEEAALFRADGDYLDRLMAFGRRRGLIDDADTARLGGEAYELLTSRCRRRTGGRSSSLPESAVRELYASLAYTAALDLCRRGPEGAVSALLSGGLDAARRRGRRIIERKLQRSCFYYGRALRYALPIDNETYVLTLRGALCGFFRIYDPLFAAHDRRIGCDYPTALPVAGLCGIEYIEEYTRRLYFESLFCSALSPDLLRAACVFYAPDSRHAIFSVMSAVLEGLILGSVGVALPAPGKKTSRADVLRRFYAAASALGHEKYLASVSETMHRAVGKAAAAAGDGEFGVFPADRNGFCDYCLAAAKKTAPELLSVSGAVI